LENARLVPRLLYKVISMKIPKLLIATQNPGKVKEIEPFFNGLVDTVRSLKDGDISALVQETGTTYEENARLKAETLFQKTGIPTLADDSGIEVDALNGQPGVHSARFAGETATDAQNNERLLKLLECTPAEKRTARFRCVIALTLPGGTHIFEGITEGTIAFTSAGSSGFGYDPVFIPDGYNKTFAELGPAVKTKLSHRTRALKKVIDFLKK